MRRLLFALALFALGVAVWPSDSDAYKGKGKGKPMAGIFSGGTVVPYDAGVDAGFDDAGIVPMLVVFGASYLDLNSTIPNDAGTPSAYYTASQRCPNDATVCAWAVDSLDGSVVAAVEQTTDNISTPIGMVQSTTRFLGQPVVMAYRAFAGTPVDNYNNSSGIDNLVLDMDTAAAWVAQFDMPDGGPIARICPMIADQSGGFQEQAEETDGGSFTNAYATPILAYRTLFANRISLGVDGGIAGADGGVLRGYSPDCLTPALVFNHGSAQGYATVSAPPARHAFVDDFIDWETTTPPARVNAGQMSGALPLDLPGNPAADGLHPGQLGGRYMAEIYGRVFARQFNGDYSVFAPFLTGATMTGPTTLEATFFVPCLVGGTCVNSPPITLDTTNLVAQTSAGAITYGFHFYLAGVLQTPPAVTDVSFSACSFSPCTAILTFAGALPDFDEVSYADSAIGLGPQAAAGGAGNFVQEVDDYCGDFPCEDFVLANIVTTNSYDGGVMDSGAADGGNAPTANAQFGDFAGAGESLQLATGASSTWDNAEAFCFFAWQTHDSTDQEAIISQFNSAVTDLRVWIGRDNGSANQITIGVANPGGGFATGFTFNQVWTAAERHHLGVCVQSAASGAMTPFAWWDGVALTPSTNGSPGSDITLPATVDLSSANLPETAWDGDADEVMVFTYTGANARALPITTATARTIMCSTRRPSDTQAPGGCHNITGDRNLLCTLPGLLSYFAFEGNLNQACEGTQAWSENGTVSFGSY